MRTVDLLPKKVRLWTRKCDVDEGHCLLCLIFFGPCWEHDNNQRPEWNRVWLKRAAGGEDEEVLFAHVRRACRAAPARLKLGLDRSQLNPRKVLISPLSI